MLLLPQDHTEWSQADALVLYDDVVAIVVADDEHDVVAVAVASDDDVADVEPVEQAALLAQPKKQRQPW